VDPGRLLMLIEPITDWLYRVADIAANPSQP
jgi:hypothetical protein